MSQSKTNPSLKTQNSKFIWYLIIVDTLLITLVLFGMPLNPSEISKVSLLTSAIGPFLGKLLNEILPPSIKAMLVFFRVHDVLPGHRAFSKTVLCDVRIDTDTLKTQVGIFPVNPCEQNKLWYRIYQKHKNDENVQEAHQNFLLFRDCASLTFLIGITTIIAAILEQPTLGQWGVIILIIGVQFLLCIVSARNAGMRFVRNVLASASTSDHKY